MKKILISLILVGMVALMSLGSMAFANDKGAEKIYGDGNICLDTEPLVVGGMNTPFGAVIFATGEEHKGTITSSNWAEIEGDLSIEVVSEVAIFDFKFNTFRSEISGRINIGDLSGAFSGTVTGSYTDPLFPLATIVESSAEVKWRIIDNELVATGSVSAIFTVSGNEFCGPLTLDGSKVDRS